MAEGQNMERSIENEVNKRLEFKLNEIKTAIKNTIGRSRSISFDSALMGNPDVSEKHRIKSENFAEFLQIFERETELPVPYDDMYQHAVHHEKEVAVEKVMARFVDLTRGRIHPREQDSMQRLLADSIETAINNAVASDWALCTHPDKRIYEFKDKPYTIVCESKMKISELWIDVVVYRAEYENKDGLIWVREKGQFYNLFKPQER